MEAIQPARESLEPPLPFPLVKLTKHPLRWMSNKLQLVVAAVALTFVGTLIVVATYYLLFETSATMTSLWHHAVSDNTFRHNVRNVSEGLLGGLLGQQVIWNHYGRRKKEVNWLDKIEIVLRIPNLKDDRRLSIGQLLASPFLVLLYATPGFFIALGIELLIRHYVGSIHEGIVSMQLPPQLHTASPSTSLWAKAQSMWPQDWDKKLMGYSASFVLGRRPARGVFDDLQLWFAERRVASGRPIYWYHPPTFKARYNNVCTHGRVLPTRYHERWQSALVLTGLAIGTLLAGIGAYVLLFVAAT